MFTQMLHRQYFSPSCYNFYQNNDHLKLHLNKTYDYSHFLCVCVCVCGWVGDSTCVICKLHVHFMFLHVLNTYVSRVGSCTWFKTQKFRPKMNVIQGLKLWRRPIFRLVPLVSRHRAVGSVQTAFILPFTLKLEAISYFETSIRQLLSYTQT